MGSRDRGTVFYRTLLENAFEGIAIVDAAGTITFQNRAAAHLLGAEEGALIGTNVVELIHPDDVEPAMRSLATLNANQGMLLPDLVRMKRRDDGRYVDLETRAVNLADNPEVQGIVVHFRDVTEHLAVVRALRASEQRLALAMNASDLTLWDWDIDSDLVDLDGALATHLGYAPDELGGTRAELFELIHPEDLPPVAEALEAHLDGRAAQLEVEHRLRTKGGDYRWFVVRGRIVERDGDGRPIRMAGTHVDVDRRRRDQEERAAFEERLQTTQRMESIGQLAGGIAHDFNNMLQIVVANAHLGMSAIDDPAVTQDALAEIEHAGRRASTLTRQLLAFARRQPLSPTSCDINQVLEQSLTMLRRVLPENIEIDFVPGHQLPPALLDAAQFELVVTNLCVNARDAMPDGGRLTIETENVVINGEYRRRHPWARPGRYLLVTVTDTGTGMDAETQRRAFEPFFTTRADSGGTGLGLAMVHGTVRQHGGLVHLYSELGVGTTIKLFWPVAERSADSIGAKLDGPVPGGRETILVVEDDAGVQRLVARILRSGGYQVLTAADGVEAIEVYRDNIDTIELVLLDAVMPKKSGREVYEEIIRLRPTRVLFTSGYSAASLPTTFLARSDLEVLPKPYSPDLLLRKVRELLEQDS